MSVIKCQSLLHSPNFASVRHTTVALSRPNYPQLADRSSRDLSQDNCVARRNRVTPDVLQDTLSLICDRDSAVRLEYTNALAGYISHEMPKYGDCPDPDGTKRAQKLADGPLLQATKTSVFLHPAPNSASTSSNPRTRRWYPNVSRSAANIQELR